MNDYMFLSESLGGRDLELKHPALHEITQADMEDNSFRDLKPESKEDLLIGVKGGGGESSALCQLQQHLMASPKPLTSPKQIDDLGILFGQLSPARKANTPTTSSAEDSEATDAKSQSQSQSQSDAFPISPRPPHGSKRRLCPRNGSGLLSNLYPRTPTLKGEFCGIGCCFYLAIVIVILVCVL